MPNDPGSWLLILGSFAVTFFLSRKFGAGFRAKRREKARAAADAAAREGESRQARRARERRGKR